jgi:putative acetyltransferase
MMNRQPMTAVSSAVSTRRALASDAEAALRVVRASITELCVADHEHDPARLEPWLRNKTTEHFCAWLADPSNHLVVAELELELVGVAALHDSGEIRLCYVKPGMQKQGIGRALLMALESQAEAWCLARLSLNSSLRACPFYERLGYRATGNVVCRAGGVCCFPYQKQLVG